MRYWAIFLLAILLPVGLQAQIEFDKLTHDFGTIVEGDMAKHRFVFKNIGKTSVTLGQVKASCGCTTPQYSRESVAPGDTGSVTAVYNSLGRPGKFTKTITVIYDTAQAPVILTISGDVTAKPATAPVEGGHEGHNHDGHNHDGHNHNHEHGQTYNAQPFLIDPKTGKTLETTSSSIDGAQINNSINAQPLALPTTVSAIHYPDTLGALAFERTFVDLATVSSEEIKDVELHIRNISQENILITQHETGKVWLQLIPVQKSIAPGQEAVIKIRFSGPEARKQGLGTDINEQLTFRTNETEPLSQKIIGVQGIFKRVLTAEEKANAPKIKFPEESFEAGEILAGESLTHTFVFHNQGKSELVIESAKASCGCTASTPKEKIILPGESSSIEATFNSQGRTGPQHKTITVISNDPETPRVTLHLKCTVKPDPFTIGDEGLPLNNSNPNPFGGGGF